MSALDDLTIEDLRKALLEGKVNGSLPEICVYLLWKLAQLPRHEAGPGWVLREIASTLTRIQTLTPGERRRLERWLAEESL